MRMRFWCESTRGAKNACDTVVAHFLLFPPVELPRTFHTKALYECLPECKSHWLGACWAGRAASLYPALYVACPVARATPLALMRIRWRLPHLVDGLLMSGALARLMPPRSDLLCITLLFAACLPSNKLKMLNALTTLTRDAESGPVQTMMLKPLPGARSCARPGTTAPWPPAPRWCAPSWPPAPRWPHWHVCAP